MLTGELYPVPNNEGMERQQERLLRAVMDQWYESEVKTDPDVMLRTLDAIQSILRGTLGMPDHVRQAVERAEQKKRKAEAEEINRLVKAPSEWKEPDQMTLLLEEIRKLVYALKRDDAISDQEP